MSSAVWMICRQEFTLNRRNRWVVSFAVLFAVLTLLVAWFGMVTSGYAGFQDFTRTTASIVNLAALLIPLFALLLGVFSFITNQHYLEILVTQPVSRSRVLLGKYLGLVLTVLGASLLGFVGAILALPAAAMIQAIASARGSRYEVVDSHLTDSGPHRRRARAVGATRPTSRWVRAEVTVGTRFSERSFAPIAVACRSGFDESLFHGAGVVVDADGRDLAAIGDPDVVVYPRSALKPLQATAMLGSGLDLRDDELALALEHQV